jgi:cell division protein FtsB
MPKNFDLGRKILSSKILLIISLLLLVFFSVNLMKEIINRQDLKREIGSLQGEIDTLEQKNREMTDLLQYFNTTDFVEKEARTKLNLRKPGEKIIIVPGQSNSSSTNNSLSAANNVMVDNNDYGVPNPEKWWNYFFAINNH